MKQVTNQGCCQVGNTMTTSMAEAALIIPRMRLHRHYYTRTTGATCIVVAPLAGAMLVLLVMPTLQQP